MTPISTRLTHLFLGDLLRPVPELDLAQDVLGLVLERRWWKVLRRLVSEEFSLLSPNTMSVRMSVPARGTLSMVQIWAMRTCRVCLPRDDLGFRAWGLDSGVWGSAIGDQGRVVLGGFGRLGFLYLPPSLDVVARDGYEPAVHIQHVRHRVCPKVLERGLGRPGGENVRCQGAAQTVLPLRVGLVARRRCRVQLRLL